MKTLSKSLLISTSLLIIVALLTSCDGLVETPEIIIDESRTEIKFTGEAFELEIYTYNCGTSSYSLVVTSPNYGPIDYFRQEVFDVTWSNEEDVELAKGIWLDCVGAGEFTVVVKNLKTGKAAKAKVSLYEKL